MLDSDGSSPASMASNLSFLFCRMGSHHTSPLVAQIGGLLSRSLRGNWETQEELTVCSEVPAQREPQD